jgi:hypothetical protein
MEEVLKYNASAKDVSSSEPFRSALFYFWYLKATCQNIKLYAWIRFHVANMYHIKVGRLLKTYRLPTRFNNLKVKTVLLSIKREGRNQSSGER